MIQHFFKNLLEASGSWFFTSRSKFQSFKNLSWLFRCWKVFDLLKFSTCSTGSISALRPSSTVNWCKMGWCTQKLPWCCSPANPKISFILCMYKLYTAIAICIILYICIICIYACHAYIRNETYVVENVWIVSGLNFFQLTGLVCLYLDMVLHGESQYLRLSWR